MLNKVTHPTTSKRIHVSEWFSVRVCTGGVESLDFRFLTADRMKTHSICTVTILNN